MSIIENAFLKFFGNKPFCSHCDLIKVVIELGIYKSRTGAEIFLKGMPYTKVPYRRLQRKVAPRSQAVEYFKSLVPNLNCELE